MWPAWLPGFQRGILLQWSMLRCKSPVVFDASVMLGLGKRIRMMQASPIGSAVEAYDSDSTEGSNKTTLAKKLALLVDESSDISESGSKSRMELKRSLQFRVKRRVKEQYINGKFHNLMAKVIANSETLQDAYNCIRLNSNIDLAEDGDRTFVNYLAEELSSGSFDINSNTYSVATRGPDKESLVLPNLKLKVVQEAIRMVLDVIYRPHFSKISYGCRSGRGHVMALKYICKEVPNCDWFSTLLINKKLNNVMLSKLISTMEEKIDDHSFSHFITSMFNAQVLNLEFGGFPKGQGLPQEGVLCAVLMNIYLDLFDHEFFRLSMRYEALNETPKPDNDEPSSLRCWFRKKLEVDASKGTKEKLSGQRVYCCRYMDEIFFAVSGPKDLANSFSSDIKHYLQSSLHLEVDDQTDILPCDAPKGIRFLGTTIRRTLKDGPAVRAVHKLKEKVKLFALQKQVVWDAGTIRIGKKWLGHGLKRVKESEIKHLADRNSVLNQISCFRKVGMETDHWYKFLLKVWMQDMKAREAGTEENILSKYVAEPSLPQELRDSFHEFQKRAQEYITSETASTLALLPTSSSFNKFHFTTEIFAPVNVIKKSLLRYRLTTSEGYPCKAPSLILQDDAQIVDWFSGLVRRWLRWYSDCYNYNEIVIIITDSVRKSCIRTLAAKYRTNESEIEKRFDMELCKIPSTEDIELDMPDETSDSLAFDDDEALTYGISYSGLCSLSLARMVSQSRSCSCFVMGCSAAAPSVYTIHAMERQKFPGWKTGFSTCIHPSLNRRRIGLCKKHLRDLYLGHISLQSINFGAWK